MLTVQKILLLLVVFVLTCWYFSFLWKRRKLYIYSWGVPGPLALPFIGSLYLFQGRHEDILEKIVKLTQTYPGLTKVWFGTKLIYFLSEPDYVEKVLINPKCLEKDYYYNFITEELGSGLLTAPVDKWRRHRKVIMPTFSQKILDSFVETFVEQTLIFSEIIQDYTGIKDINIQEHISALTMDITCETFMGLKMNLQRGDREFVEQIDRLLEIITMRIFHIWHHIECIWRLFPIYKELQRVKAALRKISTTVIKKKIETYKEETENSKNSLMVQTDEGGNKKKLAFLDHVLRNSDFTAEELREEVEIFLGAGTETTAVTLCFFLEMIGMHPEVQQRVYEEAIDILGDRVVQASDLPGLTYTERALKETMRLFPVAVYFLRTLGEDLDVGDYVLPEGSSAFIGLINIHRHQKFWPNPLKFDPDRFLPEHVANRSNCAFLPFSYGARGCIGAKYAVMNMKTFVATTIRKYKFFTSYKSVDDIKLKTKVLLRPKDGFKVYFEAR